jgi:hypothetical protein
MTAYLVEDAQVHPLGVQVHAAIVSVLAVVESHYGPPCASPRIVQRGLPHEVPLKLRQEFVVVVYRFQVDLDAESHTWLLKTRPNRGSTCAWKAVRNIKLSSRGG